MNKAREAFVKHYGPLKRYYPVDGNEEETQLAANWYMSQWGNWCVAWELSRQLYTEQGRGEEK